MRKKHSPLTYFICALGILSICFTAFKLWKLFLGKKELSD